MFSLTEFPPLAQSGETRIEDFLKSICETQSMVLHSTIMAWCSKWKNLE